MRDFISLSRNSPTHSLTPECRVTIIIRTELGFGCGDGRSGPPCFWGVSTEQILTVPRPAAADVLVALSPTGSKVASRDEDRPAARCTPTEASTEMTQGFVVIGHEAPVALCAAGESHAEPFAGPPPPLDASPRELTAGLTTGIPT